MKDRCKYTMKVMGVKVAQHLKLAVHKQPCLVNFVQRRQEGILITQISYDGKQHMVNFNFSIEFRENYSYTKST